MPLTEATISYDLADLGGVEFDPRRTKVWATTNLASQTVVDTDGNRIRLGSTTGTVAADGSGSIDVWTPGTGSNPASWQTYIHVDYPDRNATGGRGKRTFGPFTITASADLADLIEEQEVPAEYVSTVTAELDAKVAEAEAAADRASSIADIDTSDDVMAAVASDTSSAFYATQSAAIASSASLVNAKKYMLGNGTDETATLQAAIDDVRSKGQGLHFPAGFRVKTSATIVVSPNTPIVMEDGAWISYSGSGIAVDIADWAGAGTGVSGRQMGSSVLRVNRATRNWPEGTDTTSVGIRLKNINWSRFLIAEVTQFETGILLEGVGGPGTGGTAYNTITLGSIVNNKRNIRFAGTSGGWANQNTFIGGNVRHDGGISSYAGTYGIDLSQTGNNNTFLNVALEGAYTEKVVSIQSGNNMFLNCRYEANQPASFEFLDTSSENYVIGGDLNKGPGSPIFNDVSKRNIVMGARGMNAISDSSAGTPQNGGQAAFEGAASNGAQDVVFRGRNHVRTTTWEVTGAGKHNWLGTGDTFPRIVIDPTNTGGLGSYGSLAAGRGNVTPDTKLSRANDGNPAWISNAPFLKLIATGAHNANGPFTVTAKNADTHVVNLAANVTAFTISNPATHANYAQEIRLELAQDATGSRTWVAPTNVKWAGAAAPVLTTTGGRRDIFTLRYNAADTSWYEVGRSMNVG